MAKALVGIASEMAKTDLAKMGQGSELVPAPVQQNKALSDNIHAAKATLMEIVRPENIELMNDPNPSKRVTPQTFAAAAEFVEVPKSDEAAAAALAARRAKA